MLWRLQSGNSYGTGYQGVSPQALQQTETYNASNAGYAPDQQQGYNAGQADYNSSQQVLPAQAIARLSCCLMPRSITQRHILSRSPLLLANYPLL